MFAQTLNFVDDVISYDYQEIVNNTIVIGAIVAVIVGAMYTQLRKVKFSTPEQFGQMFYFGMDLRPEVADEILGICVNKYYLGVYGNTAQWGKLDENGCLWFVLTVQPLINNNVWRTLVWD